VLTPEVTNCVSGSRDRQRAVLRHEEDDPTLAALREEAAALGIWLLIGSLGIKTHDADGRFANRSFLIAPDGASRALRQDPHVRRGCVGDRELPRIGGLPARHRAVWRRPRHADRDDDLLRPALSASLPGAGARPGPRS
jgi:hypothetical protein